MSNVRQYAKLVDSQCARVRADLDGPLTPHDIRMAARIVRDHRRDLILKYGSGDSSTDRLGRISRGLFALARSTEAKR